MRYSTTEEYKDDCTRLIHSLGNIRYAANYNSQSLF